MIGPDISLERASNGWKEDVRDKTHLEQVLLVAQALLLLLPQFVQRIVMSVEIDQLHRAPIHHISIFPS